MPVQKITAEKYGNGTCYQSRFSRRRARRRVHSAVLNVCGDARVVRCEPKG